MLPCFQWWFIKRLPVPRASCPAAVLLLHLQAPPCNDLPEGSAAPAASCLCIGSLCAATVASYSLFSLHRFLHCQEKIKETPAAIKYSCSDPHVSVPHHLGECSAIQKLNNFFSYAVYEYKQWVPQGSDTPLEEFFSIYQGVQTYSMLSFLDGVHRTVDLISFLLKTYLTSGELPPSKVFWFLHICWGWQLFLSTRRFTPSILYPELSTDHAILQQSQISGSSHTHMLQPIDNAGLPLQSCRHTYSSSVARHSGITYAQHLRLQDKQVALGKHSFPTTGRGKCTDNGTTCPWPMASYWQKTHAAYAVKKKCRKRCRYLWGQVSIYT